MLKTIRVRMIGDSPLIVHNGQLADPLNPIARKMKAVTDKKKKTEADHERLAELEWRGSLYLDGGRPCLPNYCVEATLVSGAKKDKKGKDAKAGISVPKHFTLSNGTTDLSDLDVLYADGKHVMRALVTNKNGRIVRTRPMFDPWSAEGDVQYDPDLLNADDVIRFFTNALATCDWRPKYGQFHVEVINTPG